MLTGIIPFAHQLLENCIAKGDTVVDATCGNGNDTFFLSTLVGPTGHVYAFDIQTQAIETTKQLLSEKDCQNVTCIQDSHAKVNQYIPNTLHEKVGGAIFNLGYLPRSNKQIITKRDSTIQAIDSLLPYLKKGAVIVIVIYYGHAGGEEEKDAVLHFVKQLDQKQYAVLQYQFINQKNNPPFVVAIENR